MNLFNKVLFCNFDKKEKLLKLIAEQIRRQLIDSIDIHTQNKQIDRKNQVKKKFFISLICTFNISIQAND